MKNSYLKNSKISSNSLNKEIFYLNLESPKSIHLEKINPPSENRDKSKSEKKGLNKWNSQLNALKKSRDLGNSPRIFNKTDRASGQVSGINRWNQNLACYK
jgi:hypothetical protein